MAPTRPTEEQFSALASHPEEGPVVMINLLKFRETVETTGEAGHLVYDRYAKQVAPLLAEIGGKPLWLGGVDQTFIGGSAEEWDRVLMVEYPSRAAFLKMIQSPAYQEAARDREASLERTVLLVTTPTMRRS